MPIAAAAIEAKLETTFARFMNGRNLFGGTVRVEAHDGSFVWESAAGDLAVGDRYFIASTTKLYITAMVLALRSQGKLDLDNLLVDHLPLGLVVGIHNFPTDAAGPTTSSRSARKGRASKRRSHPAGIRPGPSTMYSPPPGG